MAATPYSDTADATRRTRLANERTYLAWWRTGLTALAVGVGAGRIVPALASGPRWPYTVVGVGFAVVGVALIAFGHLRRQAVEKALDRGEYVPLSGVAAVAFALAGIGLGIGVILVIALEA